ncbi:V-type proton ATPase subunit G [Amphibalanus amphitrite]|uniref:V-type proton ATPase subunit G n=1 Tax=Amphibalanus amphitrite TaxID=1232801 RepID=A0A6A4X039_AMPAM|nr:V-type proton ATPase subunit G-like [Amphibalanus amphitrite]XP_043204737.1 V-type proton ATPase subunit G-like [Amphibalanus amphitrite]XP_043204747.1 V-type proton ATPase subunit G-like [Amphibalanus amphitrite]XP_043204754.1 V-type proton ATPase subunit G-like [Amphibalanus amphitrite]XP_043204764.1 V-type proton ATPase subunit G-like [Amphibalanus amphitrite]XP_043204774.1 V-type proton ATPase subunit G-like [Amphibalanus amphitrite]XP_043204782.1 V-type proton ATPase subunit G-like [A
MAQNNQGIQHLLQAEKKASEKVAEARKRKQRRLKQAKEEAQAEIERIHKEKDANFRAVESATLGDKDKMAAQIDLETRRKLHEMDILVGNNKEGVVQQLLSLVYNIKPEMHPNARPEKLGA